MVTERRPINSQYFPTTQADNTTPLRDGKVKHLDEYFLDTFVPDVIRFHTIGEDLLYLPSVN